MQLKRHKEVARLAATAPEEHAEKVCRRDHQASVTPGQLVHLNMLLGSARSGLVFDLPTGQERCALRVCNESSCNRSHVFKVWAQVRQTFTAWLRQYMARLRQESWQTPGAAERRAELMQSCNPRCARLARDNRGALTMLHAVVYRPRQTICRGCPHSRSV